MVCEGKWADYGEDITFSVEKRKDERNTIKRRDGTQTGKRKRYKDKNRKYTSPSLPLRETILEITEREPTSSSLNTLTTSHSETLKQSIQDFENILTAIFVNENVGSQD
uniref:Uncharacterized protein n=1 Tax=Cacopsylla melanoneura TaxID=428564 RepID=A0A8D8ZC86_9HEMI